MVRMEKKELLSTEERRRGGKTPRDHQFCKKSFSLQTKNAQKEEEKPYRVYRERKPFSLSLSSKMAPADTTGCCWVSAAPLFARKNARQRLRFFPLFLKGRTREERLKVSLLEVFSSSEPPSPFFKATGGSPFKGGEGSVSHPFLLLLKPFPAYPTLSSFSFLSRLGLPNVPPSPPLFFPQSKPDISVSPQKMGDRLVLQGKTLCCDFKSSRKRNQPLPQHLDSR